ncbi:MAG: CYTH domain-containing protein [Erysipelotrichaceae bacterium]|nr:CYTH domain-containing protein [Erysipelotrichaceae bacterium]
MKAHIEKEYKMMIDENDFNRIVEKENMELIIQENYYYDLNSSKMAMRIRNIEDLYILTIKVKDGDHQLEYEYRVDDHNIDTPAIKALLKKLNIYGEPKYIGSLLTSRYKLNLAKGEIVLDLNKYLNKIDYEIEYELFDYQTNSNQELIDFLKKYQITFIENKKTKFQRFKEVLNEKN